MKKLFDLKRFKLYGWIGLSLFLWNFLLDVHEHRRHLLQNVMSNLWISIFITVLNYLVFEYTLPKLSRKRIFFSVLIFLGHSFVYLIAFRTWINIGLISDIYTEPQPLLPAHERTSQLFSFAFGTLFYFGIIRHYFNHIQLRRSAQQLLIEKQQAELNYLKSQTNPHFLFNTLNNIYSLSRDKSDLAPESILRLSKILRYMLYETSGPYTAIEQDLKIIGDYIELEKLRYDESLRVNFSNDIEDMKQALPPLLLIPLIENAFKHGVSETRTQPFVDIHLSIRNRQLLFIVSNSTGEPRDEGSTKESIGLTNLRRQLELLYSDYHLDLKQEAFEFIATLKINLASHV
ncbi:MAG: sensor histidine kinase [Chitinophagales bacterium]